MAKKNDDFWLAANANGITFRHYYNRFVEIAISRFEWEGLPDTIDPRFLELCLVSEGHVLFFKDEVLGFLALRSILAPPLDVYNVPMNRRAIANNGYQKQCDETDSVIIYNNQIRTIPKMDLIAYSKRLYNLDRIIDVNANAQKTPILIKCSQQQELTMKNVYMKYDGNMPVIMASDKFNEDAMDVLSTNAPYVCDKIYQLKTQIWNEAMTFLGINNVNITKKERLLQDEVTRNSGGVVAARNSYLDARKYACEQINKMFPELNVSCKFKENIELLEDTKLEMEGSNNDE